MTAGSLGVGSRRRGWDLGRRRHSYPKPSSAHPGLHLLSLGRRGIWGDVLFGEESHGMGRHLGLDGGLDFLVSHPQLRDEDLEAQEAAVTQAQAYIQALGWS